MRVSVFDICRRSPCRNGGTCNGNGHMYYCNCPTPYYGINCTCKYNLVKANNDAVTQNVMKFHLNYNIYQNNVGKMEEQTLAI